MERDTCTEDHSVGSRSWEGEEEAVPGDLAQGFTVCCLKFDNISPGDT